MKDAIETESLSRIFFAGKPNQVAALQGVSLRIAQGSCALLLGASGSGKTTLLSILACLDRPTSGQYRCLGEPVSRWSEKFLTNFRRSHIGVVFQQFNLLSGFTAAYNIGLPLLPTNIGAKELEKRIAQAAELANIGHKLLFPVELLSGGEQQRVAIARALVGNPSIIFADEPTAHLDSANSLAMLNVFQQLKSMGRTIVMTTHDALVTQHGIADAAFTMKDGRLQSN